MRYSGLIKADCANGPGVRVTLFVSGCTLHCDGCFNEELQDFNNGEEFTDDILLELIKALDKDYISGFTLMGGEPFDNEEDCIYILKIIERTFPEQNIMCYTGYTYEELLDSEMLKYIDILVDGKFDKTKHDPTLKFRGSSNQRIINVQDSLIKNEIILWG